MNEWKNERMEMGERVGLPRFKVHSGAQAEPRIAALLCPVGMAWSRCPPVDRSIGVAHAHLLYLQRKERHAEGRRAGTRIVSLSISCLPMKTRFASEPCDPQQIDKSFFNAMGHSLRWSIQCCLARLLHTNPNGHSLIWRDDGWWSLDCERRRASRTLTRLYVVVVQVSLWVTIDIQPLQPESEETEQKESGAIQGSPPEERLRGQARGWQCFHTGKRRWRQAMLALFILQLNTTANLAFSYWHSLTRAVPMSRAKRISQRQEIRQREKEKRCDAPPWLL